MDEFTPELFLGKVTSLSDWYDLKKDQLREVADHLKVEVTSDMRKGKLVEILFRRVGGESLGDASRQQTSSVEAQRETLEQVKVKESAATQRELARIEKLIGVSTRHFLI